jgi:ribonucleoside-diphosphate reductase alpha chain
MTFQSVSNSVYSSKYQLFDKHGNEIDESRSHSFMRVAHALAKNEKDYQYWADSFFAAMLNGAIPAGRIMGNAGAEEHKPNTSLINCIVADTIYDHIEGIGQAVKESLITLSGGSGVGYEFSSLRPKGSFVNGVGAHTSGPLPFADIFDKGCFTIASAGGRRGAQMATFDLRHPDVLAFIKAKREDSRFRQFNISVLVPHSFFNEDKDWVFRFPIRNSDPMLDTAETVWDTWHIKDAAYITNEHGQTLFKVYGKISKTELWNLILQSNYDYAEPGIIFIDHLNEENNLWFCEDIRASNPCGEQPLPPNGACLLGSIDLTQFVERPFTDEAAFDFNRFSETVDVFTRMLDNVVEFNKLPLQAQREEILRKRRHGMGFFGLGSALILLGIRYDSQSALEFAEKVTHLMALRGYIVGNELAKEKGSAPVLEEYFEITPDIIRKNPFYKNMLGTKVKGIELLVESPYMQRLLMDQPTLKSQLLQHGCRFSHHTSIAPTGTISLAFGNNTSGGIEPSFSHQYFRNLTVEGKKTRQQEAVYSKEFLLYKELFGQNKTDEELLKHLPDYFVTADSISWKAHVDMVAAVQKWVDSSISKTVNTPTNITLEEFKGIYDYAYKVGCKAVSTFRYNPETLGSILSRSEDLAKSKYEFKLADGTVIQCAGGDRVEYDGEVTTAENLFSALKENTYGKF